MPRLRLILEDDNGTQIEQTFALSGDLDTLDGIDEAVEQYAQVLARAGGLGYRSRGFQPVGLTGKINILPP